MKLDIMGGMLMADMVHNDRETDRNEHSSARGKIVSKIIQLLRQAKRRYCRSIAKRLRLAKYLSKQN